MGTRRQDALQHDNQGGRGRFRRSHNRHFGHLRFGFVRLGTGQFRRGDRDRKRRGTGQNLQSRNIRFQPERSYPDPRTGRQERGDHQAVQRHLQTGGRR